MSHIIQPTQTEGTKTEVAVTDDNIQGLLTKILQELRIMNIHLQIITDNEITKEELS